MITSKNPRWFPTNKTGLSAGIFSSPIAVMFVPHIRRISLNINLAIASEAFSLASGFFLPASHSIGSASRLNKANINKTIISMISLIIYNSF